MGRSLYLVSGRNAASSTAGDPQACLWNPSLDITLYVVYYSYICSGGGNSQTVTLVRSSTRGTPGSTVTPGIASHGIHAVAPPSGALLDLADYTGTLPVIDTDPLDKIQLSINSQGSGKSAWVASPGIAIGPGTGLLFWSGGGVGADVTFWWRE